jgi:hypothetical protein
MAIKISEIEQVFIELFEENDETVVSSIESVYETPEGGDFLKLVITIHGLSSDDISIIHTKFIFKTDLEKVNLLENTFIYLYDINCVYHKIEFASAFDLKKKIEDIVDSNDFGQDLQILSDFIEAPAMFLNYYMRRENITDYSIFDVQYQPKFKHTPCDKTTFDFKLNINNQYDMELSIKKVDINNADGEPDYYKFQFRFMDEIETFETDTLKNFHYFIGSNIAMILDKKLKNK